MATNNAATYAAHGLIAKKFGCAVSVGKDPHRPTTRAERTPPWAGVTFWDPRGFDPWAAGGGKISTNTGQARRAGAAVRRGAQFGAGNDPRRGTHTAQPTGENDPPRHKTQSFCGTRNEFRKNFVLGSCAPRRGTTGRAKGNDPHRRDLQPTPARQPLPPRDECARGARTQPGGRRWIHLTARTFSAI
jgi:hypothetical protein